MAATSSLAPLPQPPSPYHGPPTPTALKVKTKFMDRHAQEGGALTHAPPPPPPQLLPPPPQLTPIRPPPPQRLNTTPPPKKRFCPWDWHAAPPHPNPPSPPESPAPQSTSPRGMTTIPPLTPYPPTTPPYAHIPPTGLDLSVRGGVGPGGVTWPTPRRPPHSAPPPPYHRYHHLHHRYHHLHHHHHRRRFTHFPFYAGSPSQIMLSEAVMSRGQQDASLLASTPTAPRKTFDMDTTQQGTSEYKNKPMAHWTYDDIVQFFMDSPWGIQLKDMEFNFSAISGATGPELMRFTLSKFKEFSPKYGDDIYKYMQRKVASERERERADIHHYSPTIHSPPSSYSIPSPSLSTSTTSPFSPTIDIRSPLLHPQPLVCDAPARYEVRYEPPPQPRPRFHTAGGDPYSVPPTAAGKTLSLLPPPLVRMEREREERREGSDAGEGRSGESGHPREEEAKVEPPKKRGPGRPRKPENELKKKKKKTGRLWEFIRNLLLDPETCPSLVKWENAEEGMFRFVDAEKVARRWGDRKQNREMNYEKLSRAMRYYYKTHIFEAVIGRRLVYKFGKNAKGWRTTNPNFPDVHHNLPHHDPPPPPQPPPVHSPLHDTQHPDIPIHHADTPQLHHDSHVHHSEPPHHHHHRPDSLPQYHSESPPPQILHQGNASPTLLHHFHHPHLSLPHQLQPHTT